ncbi:MAG: hypothetical protein M1608_08130, partial [Candidatus Omnitrophica bacterium]|nr:hypothetical protein [Candidatus Omnitrophota bacterium]
MIQTKSCLLRAITGLCAAFLASSAVHADVKLPGLFSDNMVLQKGTHVPVWGWADDGETVTVEFR